MKKFIITLIIIIFLIGIYFFIFAKPTNHLDKNIQNNLFDFNKNINVQIRDMQQIPAKYYSGNSRFSQGKCQIDTDCKIQGCSHELCASNKNIVTSCELLDEQIDTKKYSCGCIVDTCGWYKK